MPPPKGQSCVNSGNNELVAASHFGLPRAVHQETKSKSNSMEKCMEDILYFLISMVKKQEFFSPLICFELRFYFSCQEFYLQSRQMWMLKQFSASKSKGTSVNSRKQIDPREGQGWRSCRPRAELWHLLHSQSTSALFVKSLGWKLLPVSAQQHH